MIAREIGIDLASHGHYSVRGKGVVLAEPAVVAREISTGRRL